VQVVEMVKKPDRLLHKTPEDWAREVALSSDEGILAGKCKATWKREFKLPWREAGLLNHHDASGLGPVGCQ